MPQASRSEALQPPALFQPLAIRGVTFRNRIATGPMMQYASPGGVATPWHLVHLGSRAVGGAGLVMTEQTAISSIGMSTRDDLGLWTDAQEAALAPVAAFIAAHGAVPGIQLGHSGRKGSVRAPWQPHAPLTAAEGGWQPIAPSAIPYGPDRPVPRAMGDEDIARCLAEFRSAASRAARAGFRLIEIHGAHGYLPHQFLSPLSNTRADEYGGSFDNRSRFLREAVRAIRREWPDELPLAVRLSAFDGFDGGWTLDDTARLVPLLEADGVDLFDISLGGITAGYQFPEEPAFMAPTAGEVKAKTGATVAVGWQITTSREADDIVRCGQADMVFLAREMIRNPYWPLRAAHELGATIEWERPYERGKWRQTSRR